MHMSSSVPAVPVIPRFRRQTPALPATDKLHFSCPGCAVVLNVDASVRQISGNCPACRQQIDYVRPEAAAEPGAGRKEKPGKASRGPMPLRTARPAGEPGWQRAGVFQDVEIPPQKEDRKWIPLAAGLALAAAVVILGFAASRTQLPVVAAVAAQPPPPPVPEVSQMQAQAPERERLMRESLRAFASATDHASRLELVLSPETCGPEMERYYEGKSAGFEAARLAAAEPSALPLTAADEAAGVGALRFDAPGCPSRIFFFRRPGPDAPFRLDWETYVQEMDFGLDLFLAGHGPESGIFRLRLERRHTFPADGTAGAAFAVRTLTGRSTGAVIHLTEDHPDYERLSRQLNWEHRPLATVSLRREGAAVMLDRFLCWELRGVGSNSEARGPLAAR